MVKSISITNGKYGIEGGASPSLGIRQLRIWHYNQAPKFQHAAGPNLVILQTGSGLSEFIYFSLLQ